MRRNLIMGVAGLMGSVGLLLVSGAGLVPGLTTAVASSPVIDSVSPNAGPSSGGTPIVTLSGSGFQAGATVKFGGVNGTVQTVSASQIDVQPPAEPGFPHTVAVEVDNTDAGVATLPNAFTYYESLPPGQLNAAAGATLFDDPGGPSERLHVFGRGTDNTVYHTWQIDSSGHWANWEPQGGALRSAPSVTSWAPGRLDLFGRGTDDALWHKWWNGSGWSGWESLGGVLRSAPAATSWGAGRLDVFVRGTDDVLYHKWYDGTRWNGYESLGGTLTSDPGGVSLWSSAHRIDVFVRGTDNGVWHRWYDGTRWLGFEGLGGTLTSAPAAASNDPRNFEVLALGQCSDLYYLPYSDVWKAWRPVGTYWNGNWAFGPTAAAHGFYILGVDEVEVASDGSVWHANLPHSSVVTAPTKPRVCSRPAARPSR